MCNTAPDAVALYLHSEGKRPSAIAPTLPAEITHVWLADTGTFSSNGIHWSPEFGWELSSKH